MEGQTPAPVNIGIYTLHDRKINSTHLKNVGIGSESLSLYFQFLRNLKKNRITNVALGGWHGTLYLWLAWRI